MRFTFSLSKGQWEYIRDVILAHKTLAATMTHILKNEDSEMSLKLASQQLAAQTENIEARKSLFRTLEDQFTITK
jgi:hypothetical protein